jgi:hypothetical protein
VKERQLRIYENVVWKSLQHLNLLPFLHLMAFHSITLLQKELKIFSKLEDYTSCLVVLCDRGVFKMEQLTWNLNNGNVS